MIRLGRYRAGSLALLGALVATGGFLLWLGLASGMPAGHGPLFAALVAAFLAADGLYAAVLEPRAARLSRAARRRSTTPSAPRHGT